MVIWLIEDDPAQAEIISAVLKKAFEKATLDVIRTELQFRQRLKQPLNPPPSVIVLDMMLPWTEVESTAAGGPRVEPLPPNYDDSGGRHRAGIRCASLLHQNETTRSVPVVLLTVLTEGDLAANLVNLPTNVKYKSKREEPEALVSLIRDLTGQR